MTLGGDAPLNHPVYLIVRGTLALVDGALPVPDGHSQPLHRLNAHAADILGVVQELRIFFDIPAQGPAPFQVAAADQVGTLFRGETDQEPLVGD